jgi:AcrR family transcriptional regulator
MATAADNRGPGRPSSEHCADVRGALLEAARECIVEVGFAAASTKLIAARAGVNPAMISYYFGGKAALGEAAFRATIEPLGKRLDELAGRLDGSKSAFEFIREYMATMAADPWIPRIIAREVLPQNGRFRDIFFREITGRGAALLPQAIVAAQHDGLISATFDPRFAMVSLASLAAFPFLAADMLKLVLGLDLSDEKTFAAFADHTLKLMSRGLGATAANG